MSKALEAENLDKAEWAFVLSLLFLCSSVGACLAMCMAFMVWLPSLFVVCSGVTGTSAAGAWCFFKVAEMYESHGTVIKRKE